MKQVNVTDEEYREIVMRRVDKSLREHGVELPDHLRREIASLLPTADGTTAHQTAAPSRQAARLKASPDGVGNRPQHAVAPGIKPVEHPRSNADRVLNALLGGCSTVPELAKATKRTSKQVYTALWMLKRDGVIDVDHSN